ncbi:uncharacterized protein [Engystomops pustulosus]|uniref:uncharacterized protein n=1 Tax=Engystomops pustulosus TaxID=76066 RepID=UPI003AFB2A9C
MMKALVITLILLLDTTTQYLTTVGSTTTVDAEQTITLQTSKTSQDTPYSLLPNVIPTSLPASTQIGNAGSSQTKPQVDLSIGSVVISSSSSTEMSPDTTHSSMENMFLITSSPSQSPNDFRDGKETSDISPNLQDVLLSPSSAPIVENLPTETGYTSTTFTLFPDSTLSANPSEEKTSTDDTTYPEILSTSLDDTTFIDGYGTSQADNSSPYPSSLDSSNLQDVLSSPSSAPTVENLFTETGYTSTTFTLVPESTLSSNPSQPKTISILTVDTSLLDTSTSMSGDITFSDSNETPQPITYSANIHSTDLDTAKMSPLKISPSENPSTSGSTIMSDIDTLSAENPRDMNNTPLFPPLDIYNTSPSEIEGTSPYASSTNIPTTYIAPSVTPANRSSTEKTGVSLVDTTYLDKSSTDDNTYTEILSTSPGDTTFIDGNGTSRTDNLSPYPSSFYASNPSSNVDMVDSEETSTASRTSVTSSFEAQTHTTFTPDNLSSSEKTPTTYTSFTTSITDNNSPADKSSGVILDTVPSESSVSDSTFTEIPETITVDTSYSVESQTSYSVSQVDFSSQDISGTLRIDVSSQGESFSSSSITYPEDSTSTDILIVNISSPVESQATKMDFTSSDTQSSLTNGISSQMESKTSHMISPKNIITSDIPVTSKVDISSPVESQTSLTTSPSSDTAGIFPAKTISPEKSQTSHITAAAPDTPVDITSPVDVFFTDTLDTSTLVDNSSPEILSAISALIVPSPSGGTWPTSEGSGSTFSETYPSSSNDLLRSKTNIYTSTAPASLESTHQVSTSDTTSSTTSSENFNTTSSTGSSENLSATSSTTSSENLSMTSSTTSSENFNTTFSTTSSENLRTTSSTTSSITSSITSSETLSTTSSTTSSTTYSKNFDTTSSTTSSENFGTTSSENLSTISSTTNSENFGTTSSTTPSVTVPSPSGSTWPTTESSRSILSSPVKISSAETVTSYPSSSNDLLRSTTNIHTSTAPASLESTHQVSTSDTTSSTTSGEIFGKTSSTTRSENFSTTSSTISSEKFDTTSSTTSSENFGTTSSESLSATSSTTSSEKFDTTSSTISSENVGPTSTMIYSENLDTASSTTSSVPSPSGTTWPSTESPWSIFSSPVVISSAETVTSYPSTTSSTTSSDNFGTTSTTTPSVTVPSPSGSTWPTTESPWSIYSSPVRISSPETVTSYPSSSNDMLRSTTNIHTSTALASLESTHQVSTSDTTSSTTSSEIAATTSSTTPAVPSTTLPHLFNGTDLLYPFGPTLDSISLKIDDGGTGVIYLPINIPLFGNVYNILYVNNNGLLSFYLPIVQWYPQKLPVASNNPFLAVFWSDVDNTVAGDIYYRSSTEPELLARASSDIRTYFYSTNFTGSWVIVATWDRVAYYGSSGSKNLF